MSDTVEALNAIYAALDMTNGYLSLILQELREANKPKPVPAYTINNKLARCRPLLEPVVIRQAAKS